jgi:hypothetical protein
VAPGGWLLVEDFDWATGGPGDDAPAVAKAYHDILERIESVGYDRHYGRTLLRRLERSGLEETGSEGRAYVLRGGSPGTAFDRFSMLAQREALLGSEALTEPESRRPFGTATIAQARFSPRCSSPPGDANQRDAATRISDRPASACRTAPSGHTASRLAVVIGVVGDVRRGGDGPDRRRADSL